jgi:hypothetical protein
MFDLKVQNILIDLFETLKWPQQISFFLGNNKKQQ